MFEIFGTGTLMSVIGFLLLASTKAHTSLNENNKRLLNILHYIEVISAIFIFRGYAYVFVDLKTLFVSIHPYKLYITMIAYSVWTFVLLLLSVTFEECLLVNKK
jgi:hypothetical protein